MFKKRSIKLETSFINIQHILTMYTIYDSHVYNDEFFLNKNNCVIHVKKF